MIERIRQWRQFVSDALFDRGGLKLIFEHARNLVVATLIIAAGLEASHGSRKIALAIDAFIIGNLVALVGLALLVLNFLDGLRLLTRLHAPRLLQWLLALTYVVFSWRVAQLVLMFRSHPG